MTPVPTDPTAALRTRVEAVLATWEGEPIWTRGDVVAGIRAALASQADDPRPWRDQTATLDPATKADDPSGPDANRTHHFLCNETYHINCEHYREYAALRESLMASSEPGTPQTKLDAFVEEAAAEMRTRLDHGTRKFGVLSWRTSYYNDRDNAFRLRRAVNHLAAALRNDAGPDEVRKRAADVANQAFMFADPERDR